MTQWLQHRSHYQDIELSAVLALCYGAAVIVEPDAASS